jgi:hypothetical protein
LAATVRGNTTDAIMALRATILASQPEITGVNAAAITARIRRLERLSLVVAREAQLVAQASESTGRDSETSLQSQREGG